MFVLFLLIGREMVDNGRFLLARRNLCSVSGPSAYRGCTICYGSCGSEERTLQLTQCWRKEYCKPSVSTDTAEVNITEDLDI